MADDPSGLMDQLAIFVAIHDPVIDPELILAGKTVPVPVYDDRVGFCVNAQRQTVKLPLIADRRLDNDVTLVHVSESGAYSLGHLVPVALVAAGAAAEVNLAGEVLGEHLGIPFESARCQNHTNARAQDASSAPMLNFDAIDNATVVDGEGHSPAGKLDRAAGVKATFQQADDQPTALGDGIGGPAAQQDRPLGIAVAAGLVVKDVP